MERRGSGEGVVETVILSLDSGFETRVCVPE